MQVERINKNGEKVKHNIELTIETDKEKSSRYCYLSVDTVKTNGKCYQMYKPSSAWFFNNCTTEQLTTIKGWFDDFKASEEKPAKPAKKAKPANKGKAQGKAVKGLAAVVAKLEDMEPLESVELLNARKDGALVALATHYNGKKPHHKVGRNKLMAMVLEALHLDDTVDAIDGVAVLKVEPEDDLFADLDYDMFEDRP